MNQEFENDPSLNRLLSRWRVDSQPPPGFKEQVWRRVERGERRPEPNVRTLLARWLEVALPRPRFAYSYAALLLACGVAAGAWTAQVQNTRMTASLGSRYLQSIDPYQPVSPTR
jgi:hypothetical protein